MTGLPPRPLKPPKPSVKPGLRGSVEWKFSLMGGLATQGTPRVFTAAALLDFVHRYRPSASASTARAVADALVAAGALRRVSSGLFLNMRALPPADLTEAASHIRSGAVISLHSVLGACGFLNNPSAVVMAVLPSSAAQRPRLGDVKTSSGDRFRFYGLAEKFFPETDADRWGLLQPGRPCATFRPEAALLQWLHLAGMQRSSLTAPPLDVDMEAVDVELLNSLAKRWELSHQLEHWLARARASNFGEQTEPPAAEPLVVPTRATVAAGSAARARLMARRPKSGS